LEANLAGVSLIVPVGYKGFYAPVSFNGFRPMVAQQTNSRFDEPYRSEFRRNVSSQNQFQLPALLVGELGFESLKYYSTRGAMAAWYYHEEDDRAVLASDEVDRPSLEFVGVSSLSGVSNDDLASGGESAAQVTIITELPDHLHTKLTRNAVVLKPIYASEHSTLDGTCVSVYPAAEYDDGTLPNVCREVTSPDDDESESSDETSPVGSSDKHANYV